MSTFLPMSDLIVEGSESAFSVHLSNFDGPFDLLLQLISRHKMDITEIALGVVTDDFIAYIKALEGSEQGWDLDQTTEFLVVAATLLDLKAARLLPSGEIEDEGDLALLEARDLLFARLLQYRAFKEIAAIFQGRIDIADKSFPRLVAMESHFAQLLPEVLIGVGANRSIAAIEASRAHAVDILKEVPEADWNRVGVHSQRGEMSLTDLLALTTNHRKEHIEQLKK